MTLIILVWTVWEGNFIVRDLGLLQKVPYAGTYKFATEVPEGRSPEPRRQEARVAYTLNRIDT